LQQVFGENAHEHSHKNTTAMSLSSHAERQATLHLHRLNISENNTHFGKHGEREEGKKNNKWKGECFLVKASFMQYSEHLS